MIQGKSILVVILLAALSAGGCSRSSDKEEEEEASSSRGGGISSFIPLFGSFSSGSSSSARVTEARPVQRFSGDIGTGSRADVTARGSSFFSFGRGS